MNRAKVVLVTGASTGIGRATALEMKKRGWRVFATVRRQADVVDLTKVGRGMIEPLIMDVTDQAQVERAFDLIAERAGRLDALVNNAGIAIAGPLERIPPEKLATQFEVNVLGVHRVTQAALPMLRASQGRIVMMSSIAGEETYPFYGPYSASKHALEAYSDALRLELHGMVKVVVVQPGTVSTPIWAKGTSDELLEYANEHYPLAEIQRLQRIFSRVGARGIEPEAVAEVVAKALELPWPPPHWPVMPRRSWPSLLLRLLPSVITDRIKLAAFRWPPRG